MARILAVFTGLALLATTPVQAQSNVSDRIERLEKQLRAVQRKVFPGGAGEFFEAEIQPESGPAATPTSTTSAVTDLIARVDALEAQLQTLTGQVEENGFRIKKIEDQLAAVPDTMTSEEVSSTATTSDASAGGIGTASTNQVAAESTEAPSQDDARLAAVSSVEMPDTGDAGEDSYIYGFRLWDADYFPEAQAQLKKTLEDHPDHARASHAQNLLGRAYLDDGKPALASVQFYENYQKRPRGARAPDSLIYLGTALIRLDKKPDACRVYQEFQEVYPDAATGRLSDFLARGLRDANCG